MKKNALYEVEIQRSNVTPRRFWGICAKEIERRTGYMAHLTDWVDDFERWSNPPQINKTRTETEVCKTFPYDFQFYLRGGYNFIMEFNFWDDKTGNGYLYLVEFDR